jgi:Putative zincin peptidase
MRLHFGSIPDEFTPSSSWRSIREPDAMMMQVYALPIGFVVTIAVLKGWMSIFDSLPIKQFDGSLSAILIRIIMILSFPVLVIVHELFHAFVHPHFGRSNNTVLGIWPKQFLFYAHYSGALSRNRFLTIGIMPFLVITVLPLLLATVVAFPRGLIGFLIAWCSTWNALFSCLDLLGFVSIFFQIPKHAIVQNKAWQTFWRPSTENQDEPSDAQNNDPASPVGKSVTS